MLQPTRWLRLGLGATILSCGVAASLIACSDDEDPPTNTPDGGGNDSGTDGTTPQPEAGDGDGGTDADATTAQPAKLTFIHAATDLGPNDPSGRVYVCFATSPRDRNEFSVAPLPPLPNTALGLPIGAGGYVRSSTGILLEDTDVKPFLINADKVNPVPDGGFPDAGDAGTRPDCQTLIGVSGDAGTLTPNVDFWALGTIPAGTLKNDHSLAVAVTGCAQDTAIVEAQRKVQCGQDFDTTLGSNPGVGNLRVRVFELTTAQTPPDGGIGVQYAQLSPSYAASPAYGIHSPTAFSDPDGGADAGFPLTGPGADLATFPQTAATPLVSIPTPAPTWSLRPASLAPPVAGVSFGAISAYSGGTTFTAGKNYFFVYVGAAVFPPDPNQGKNFHPLAFPINPE